MCFGGGGGDGGAAAASKQEAQRQANITKGTQDINAQFAHFDPAFYAGQAANYQGYAQPQLDTQFNDARKQLIFALSRSGLLNSSTAADKQRKLLEEKSRYQTDVINRGQQYAQTNQANNEDVRNRLISQLTATNDPNAALANATRAADLASRPPPFDPVGNFVFQAGQGINQYAGPATGYRGIVGSPLNFSGGGSNVSYH